MDSCETLSNFWNIVAAIVALIALGGMYFTTQYDIKRKEKPSSHEKQA